MEKDKPQVSVLLSAKEENSIEAGKTTLVPCSLQSKRLQASERSMVARKSTHIAEKELSTVRGFCEIFFTRKDGKIKTLFTQLLCEMYWTDLLSANSVLSFHQR